MIALLIKVEGLVQGVGFRPSVYRLAVKHGIRGWVANNNEGVTIHAEADQAMINVFLNELLHKSPPAADIRKIDTTEASFGSFNDFSIKKSDNLSEAVTEVSPDIAVCEDCLADMEHQSNRLGYPFTNCTNCGPRFSIIKALPYDRIMTTMDAFKMCPACLAEYNNILDRRFHAQPVACNQCGPSYTIASDQGHFKALSEAASAIAGWIDQGQIVAMKGMGGFHLICDARNEAAIQRLRTKKQREGKPMAVMTTYEKARSMFSPSPAETQLLKSWRSPIVLMNNRHEYAPSVSNGLNSTGIVLPYMPIHHMMFRHLKTDAIILTSGNYSEAPVIIDNDEAMNVLSQVTDKIIGYNRDIFNRADDSVAMVVAEKTIMIRRSRGYAPSPIHTGLNCEGIFAAGAELVNTFAIGKGNQLIPSQHIGDLKNAETLAFYEESFERFSKLFRFKPQLAACDLHPDYLSTRFAHSLGVELIEVQHHHAHIASCMAENGLDEKVIGIALDGTGYGDDQTIWGGEFFVCNLAEYERVFHFDPIPLPGGDKVTSEPWRSAISFLYHYFGNEIFEQQPSFLNNQQKTMLPLMLQAIDLGVNAPLSSGAGRLFDAVAALTGICTNSSFHAEAPMRLEAAIKTVCRGKYAFDIEGKKIVFRKLFYLILKDLKAQVPVEEIAAKFHNTIVLILLTLAKRIRETHNIHKVVLSGGTFQNRYLLSMSYKLLSDAGFKVYLQQKMPANDGGIALGQAAVASKLRSLRKSSG